MSTFKVDYIDGDQVVHTTTDNIDETDLAVTQGSIIVGNASGAGAELDASTDTQILVGDGTTIASVAVSGDATLANTGALTLAVPKVRGATLHTWDEAAAAADVVTVTGVDAADVLVATINVRGANNPTTVLSAVRTGADSVTVTLDQNGENAVTVVSVVAIQVA